MAGDPRCVWMDQHEPIGGDGVGLALELEWRQRFNLDGVTHQAESGLTQEDLARRCRLLESSRHVHGVAADETLGSRRRVLLCHDLARVHTDTDLERHSVVALQLLVERGHCAAHFLRGPDRSQSVVLVERGDAEDGHHRVSDELLHGPPVPLDRGGHLLEVPAHNVAEGLWVKALAE